VLPHYGAPTQTHLPTHGNGCAFRLPRQSFDFSSLTPGGTKQELVLGMRIEVITFRELTLWVRVHAITVTGQGKLRVLTKIVTPSWEQPNVSYVDPTPIGSLDIHGSVAPELRDATLKLGYGTCIQVSLEGTQDHPSVSDTIQAALSIDVFGRR